jgi:aminoacyl-tRNA hydrolase
MAALHRRRLDKVTFVAVTGSAGKTMTSLLAAAVLGTAGRTHPPRQANRFEYVMAAVLATQPDDDFCVVEMGAGRSGWDRALATVRPRIGVVTAVGTDHLKMLHSIEAIAEEKAKLIACLPADGTAVLNADDLRVLAMADRFAGNIITFGRAEGVMLRAEHVRSPWPERLSFTAVHQDHAVEVRTRLCGTHWTSAVLAALAVGLAAGIPLDQAAKAIAAVEPSPSRMYPITSDNGVTFIVDDWKSPLWIMQSAFDFLRSAEADRKIIAIGTIGDYSGNAQRTYTRVARAALDVADHVVFVGPMATHALRAKTPETAERLHAFANVKDAANFLHPLLRRGDLVLLKGHINTDHLGRLAHHWLQPISCWRMDCGKNTRCDACSELRAKATKAVVQVDPTPAAKAAAAPAGLPQCRAPMEVLVGIGNPEARHRNTPHNVGFAMLDALAARLSLSWSVHDDVMLAHTTMHGKTLLLVKPQTYVNNTGKCLKGLSDALGFRAEDCILIQDDIHLPLGKLRSRARGSDGGHKGVRSVLVNFQTGDIRRLKIGVAPAEPPRSAVEYFVSPLPPEALAVLEPAVEAAVDRLLSMLAGASRPPNDAGAVSRVCRRED